MPSLVHIATVPQTLTISGIPVTSVPVNQAYSGFAVSAKGGNKPYTFSVASGTLPSGIAVNPATGAVSGTPTVITLATGVVIRVTDFAGRVADLPSFSINVTP